MIHSNNLEILKLLLLFPISTIQQFFRDMIASIDRVRSRKKKKFAGELGWTVSNGIFWRCTCFIECMILHLCGSDPADAFVRGVLYLCLALASRNSWRKRKERKTRDQRWFSDRKFRRKFIARDKSGNLRIILESRRTERTYRSSLRLQTFFRWKIFVLLFRNDLMVFKYWINVIASKAKWQMGR